MDYLVQIQSARLGAGEPIDFQVKRGDLVLLIDPQETLAPELLAVMAGIKFLTAGSLEIFGQGEHIDRRRIAYLPQSTELKSSETVEKLLIDWAKALNLADPRAAMQEVLALLDLTDEAPLVVNDLSREQRDYLLFAGALLGSPDLILINLGSKFMPYRSRKRILNLLDRLVRLYGVTIIMAVSAIDDFVEAADQIYLVRNERLMAVNRKLLDSRARASIIVEVEEPERAAVSPTCRSRRS